MKIFYAVQATGNGHISRAMELLPHLQQYGTVDIFLSGSNSTLDAALPVVYRNKGISFYYTENGKLNFLKTAAKLDLLQAYRYAKALPLKQYDLIINDFESITSLAVKLQKLPSIHFGHQASFLSDKTPRPKRKDFVGECILKHYVTAKAAVGLHFEKYDSFILPPVIKSEIWNAHARDQGFITVYLPSYGDKYLLSLFEKITAVPFKIFSRETKSEQRFGHIHVLPVDKNLFNDSLINCHGIITNAGFETPAEAMQLNKKILAIPIQGQYEQVCNAAAMARLGVMTLPKIEDDFVEKTKQWLEMPATVYDHTFRKSTEEIVRSMMDIAQREEVFISQSRQ